MQNKKKKIVFYDMLNQASGYRYTFISFHLVKFFLLIGAGITLKKNRQLCKFAF